MPKLYKVLVNEGNGAETKPINVMQGAGDSGLPMRIVAQRGVRYELQDVAKGKGIAPDQVRVKRMGKNLALLFDSSQKPDVVVEDFYAVGNPKEGNIPVLAGFSENGSVYEYIPQDPALNSVTPALADGNTPVLMSLGGGALSEGFVLSALPLAAAAAGGVSGWAIAGAAAGAAALAGGGGGGGGAAPVLASGQKGELTHNVTNDTGVSVNDSVTKVNNPELTITAEAGATVVARVNGKDYAAVKTDKSGVYKVKIDDALRDGVYTPEIKVTNAAGTSSEVGTPFTVDTSADTNHDPSAKPTLVADANASAEVTISIGGIDDGSANLSKGSVDTGTSKTDYLTSDNTLVFSGVVQKFAANTGSVRVQVIKSNNVGDNTVVVDSYVRPTSDGIWTLNNQANSLSDGRYTIKAEIVDAAGNSIKTASQSFRVANETPVLIAENDDTEVLANAVVKGNVLVNDSDSTASALTVVSAKANSASTSASVSGTPSKVAAIDGVYGQLALSEDGNYTYTPTSKAKALLAGEQMTDSFSYDVSADGARMTTANLDIVVTGVNDVAVIKTKYTTQRAIIYGSKLDEVDTDAISVKDANAGQNDLSQITAMDGKFGQLELNPSATKGVYGWKYTTTGKQNLADTVQHDLFTLMSKDGTASTTLDFQLQAIEGVKSHVAFGRTDRFDTLTLDTSTATTFDLTGVAAVADTRLAASSVEKIDIAGKAGVNNTIKLSLDGLTQADDVGSIHTLYITGDGGDAVNLVKPAAWVAESVLPTQTVNGHIYNLYHLDATHDLLIHQAITNVTFS